MSDKLIDIRHVVRRAMVCLAAVAVGGVAFASPAAALGPLRVPAPPQYTTTWVVVDKTTVAGTYVDKTRPVASCSAGAGGTCTISRATAVSTTVQTSLGYSKSGVAASIGFSLTRMSTTTVTCVSPRMRAGQTYVGYSEGTAKHYRIQEWHGSSFPGGSAQLAATSGLLLAYQPYNYSAIYCQVQ